MIKRSHRDAQSLQAVFRLTKICKQLMILFLINISHIEKGVML